MPHYDNDPNRPSAAEIIAVQSEKRAIAAATRWAQAQDKERFSLSNALWVIKLWNGAYKPEATLLRKSAEISGNSSMDNVHAFQEFYIAEANDHLHTQRGPVIIAEIMKPVDEAHDAYDAECAHCSRVLPGAAAKIVGAKDPTDITLTLDHFRGTASDSLIRVAADQRDEVLSVEMTDMDIHVLDAHTQEEEGVAIFGRVLQLASYIPLGGHVDLELPQFRAPNQ